MSLTSSSASASDWLKDRQFGVVLDAGSSGTRIQVYSWKSFAAQLSDRLASHQPTNTLLLIQTGVQRGNDWQLKVEPGISSFGSHPHHLGRYLRPLLDHALKIIPAEQVSSTLFYLLATAGMRLLPQSQQDQILHEACSYIQQNYQFPIIDCQRHIRIISGEEEGIFGWISVNYLMDGFSVVDQLHPATTITPSSSRSTFGFLDMGGASTQIAFEPNKVERIQHADNLTNLTLRLLDGTELTHSVFVTTWLGYGTNKARERYSDKLIESHRDSVNHLSSPQPKLSTIPDPCLPTALVLPSPSSQYQLNGTGDFKRCIRNISPLLNKDAPCLDQPCLFDGKHVPPIDFSVNRFIGISEYWYSTQDIWSMGGIYDFVEFEKKAISYCKQNWEEIIQEHMSSRGSGGIWPTEMELSRLESQCFKAAWIINILHEGIGLPRIIDQGGQGNRISYNQAGIEKASQKGLINHSHNFQSLNEVGNITVSWTLGKIVLELSQLSPGSSSSGIISPSLVGDQIHSTQLEGLKSHLSAHVKSWFGPMILFATAFAVLMIWLLCSCLKTTTFQFGKNSHVAQGYMLTSMEEGDASRRDNSSIHYSRSPRSFRKPSLSSSRDFLLTQSSGSSYSWIRHTFSRAMGMWRVRKGSSSNQKSLSISRSDSPRSSRPSRMASPNPLKLLDGNGNNFCRASNAGGGGGTEKEEDEDQNKIIPPISITTSLSAPAGGTGYQANSSARNSTDEGLFASIPLSRTGSGNGSNSKTLKRLYNDDWNTRSYQLPHETISIADPHHLHPDRPKQRFVHSKSFQTLPCSSNNQDNDLHLDSTGINATSTYMDRSSTSHDAIQFSHSRNHIDSKSCSNLNDYL